MAGSSARASASRATSARRAARSVRHADRLALDYSHFTGSARLDRRPVPAQPSPAHTWAEVMSGARPVGRLEPDSAQGACSSARYRRQPSHCTRRHAPGRDSDRQCPRLDNLPIAGSMLAAAGSRCADIEVSWPLEPCRYDLLASRGDETLRVQVKTSRSASRRHAGWQPLAAPAGSCRGLRPRRHRLLLRHRRGPRTTTGPRRGRSAGLQQISLQQYAEVPS